MGEYDQYSVVKYNDYEIITQDTLNPYVGSPTSQFDIYFYQTRSSLLDPDKYKSFLKNAERRFRASKEYKLYKSVLMNMGFDHCQIMGNIEVGEKVEIELHHNIISLFDIFIMISEHVLNTVGKISTFDLIQLVINEHFNHNIPCTFLSTTAHELFTNDPEAYIPPEQTWGRWWVLLEKYKFGITYDIANKLIKYINKYQAALPSSINIMHQEQILNFAYMNQYGIPEDQLQFIEDMHGYNTTQPEYY